MLKIIPVTFLFCCALSCASAQLQYINPVPGTGNHNRETNIILKNGNWIDKESIKDNDFIAIKGSNSGSHKWLAHLSDDHKTIAITPIPVFNYGETVSVIVHSKLETASKEKIEGTSFSFRIKDEPTAEDLESFRRARVESFREEYGYDPFETRILHNTRDQDDTTATYPPDSMPSYVININNNPSPGQIFFSNHENQTGPEPFTNSFNTIIENDGSIVWAFDAGKEGNDFKLNDNGYLTYFVSKRSMWMIMDSSYNIVDSVQCKNGYESSTNEHDLMMYPDGHVFLIAYDNAKTDMTAFGGEPNTTVQYCVLQELDSSRNVVFEWRSADPGHFLFTDANQYTSLTVAPVDYVHCNAFKRDYDGNIIISCRNMDEITRINHSTGNIIWRLGGENNQFSFMNDNNTAHFAMQHDLNRIANGNITIFNNARNMIPQRSSAKEYSLDEIHKIATLVWYYEHPDVNGVKVYGSATGSAQRLPNGNTMIDWGKISWGLGIPNQTEVDSLGNIKWEMTWDSVGQKSYCVHKYEWNPCARPTSGLVTISNITSSSAKINWTQATGWISYDLQYRLKSSINWKLKTTLQSVKKLKNLKSDSIYVFRIRTHCADNAVSGWTPIDTFKTAPQRVEFNEEVSISFNLYPNPVSQWLQLSLVLTREDVITISVLDIMGKIISQSSVFVSAGEQQIRIDVRNISAGFYIIGVKTSSGNLTERFVKQ